MFTGIVEEVGGVEAVRAGGLTVAASKVMDDLGTGSSISVNGACLTVTWRSDLSFSVDVVPETLRRTNLGFLKVGDPVNLERSVPVDGRLDGHIVQGHVDGTGTISTISSEEDALLVGIRTPPSLMRYIVEKGFIAVDGVSLTVVSYADNEFVVTIIPYTRDNTVFGSRVVGDKVNLEVDILAKYLERLTSAALAPNDANG